MLVVGLLSGGKDSVYNLLHCIVNGHQPIALASLAPPEGKDELDSYMYQTVGHSGLQSIAQALDLPLHTREIRGTALELGAEYGDREGGASAAEGTTGGGRKGDETEDLYELLLAVKAAHPDVQGVACGAILSNYQRVRVEHVCSRLGLTPIAYLWERGQKELLGEMVKAEMRSLLVKVAGAGLQVEHLGRSLAEMEPTLHRLNNKYQLHICGEGGEYETFTVDCPLFRRAVLLDKITTVVTDSSSFSTIAHLHLDSCSLGPLKPLPSGVKGEESFDQLRERLLEVVTVPPVLDGRSRKVVAAARASAAGEVKLGGLSLQEGKQEAQWESRGATSRRVGEWVYFGEVMARGEEELSIEDEVRGCFAELSAILSSHSLTLLHLTHLTLYLSPLLMSHFPQINAIYTTYFGTSPPTRACVSIHPTSFPSSRQMKLEGLAGEGARSGLHVQSLSYWAPANIGPYSQAILTSNQRLFIAGQIPLLPASLTLPTDEGEEGDFAFQVALSLQHVRRAKEAVAGSGGWEGWSEGGVCWIAPVRSEGEWRERVGAARKGWREWERRSVAAEKEEDEDDEEEEAGDAKTAPMLFVQAEVLPKGAGVEWQVTFATGITEADDEEEEDSSDEEAGEKSSGRAESWADETISSSSPSSLNYQCSQSNGIAKVANAILACDLDQSTLPPSFSAISQIHSIKAFHLPHVSHSQIKKLASTLFNLHIDYLPALSTVGVGRISTSEGAQGSHEVAFVVTAGVREL